MSQQHKYYYLLPLLIFLMAFLLIGCGRSASGQLQDPATEAIEKVIPTPNGYYGRLAWINDWLVLSVYAPTEKTKFSGHLWRVHSNGQHAEQLRIPEYAGCEQQGVEPPSRLPDNRLGYILNCRQSNFFEDKLYMMAYDMQTGLTESLLPYALPSTQVGTGGYSWNPTMTRGITSDGNGRGLSEQLYWLNPDRSESRDVGMPQD